MEIKKENGKIIFEFPERLNRSNPYMEEESERGELGTYPYFTGLIIRHKKDRNNWNEIGFANTIDRDYKDKSDDVGGIIVEWDGSEEEFIKKCEELKIGIHEFTV